MRNNVQKVIRSFRIRDLREDSNEIDYVVNSNWNKIAVFDSELLRIVEAADPSPARKKKNAEKKKNLKTVWGLISLKIGWGSNIYEKNIAAMGGRLILRHVKKVNINKGKKGADGKKLPPEYEYQQVLDKNGNQIRETFVRLIVGSSQGREKKALYVREDLYEDVHKVLLGGMDELAQINGFPKFSGGYAKWNAYYGLASTDSVAVEYVPKIVVVKDFEREVKDIFDVLKPVSRAYPGEGEESFKSTEYEVENGVERTVSIKPFDGAGLVSVECARKWAEQLGLDPESQLPAAFQIRVIPGIKGNLYTFDIKKFGRRFGGRIRDYRYDPQAPEAERGKREHDPEQVDIILTESQVKFLKMYGNDLDLWRIQFDQPVMLQKGRKYKRTFNISEIAPGEAEVRGRVSTAYQHWQTIYNTEKECEKVSCHTIKQLEKISTEPDAFLKYRCHTEEEEDPNDSAWGQIRPYYRAAYCMEHANREVLFADPYFQSKAEEDLKGAYRRALMGKLSIEGNYQYLTPDLFALARHSFGMEVTGLLPAGMIYSAWWLARDKKVPELALIRNPHIYMEARVASMACAERVGRERFEEMKEWYRYQTTGIITDSYSTIPLALGTADFDGDIIITTDCVQYIRGVKRAIKQKGGRTLLLDMGKRMPPVAENVCDRAKLLETDILAYRNDIGKVVNKVTYLWHHLFTKNADEKEKVLDIIKTMAIIGQLTIDAAKTGEAPEIPASIRMYDEKLQKPRFMEYQRKDRPIPKEEGDISSVGSKANNMDRICRLVEEKLVEIRKKKQLRPKFQFSTEQFLKLFLVGERPAEETPFYKEVSAKMRELAEENGSLFRFLADSNKEDKEPHYRYLYQYAREELFAIAEEHGVSGEELLDCLIWLAYTDAELLESDGAKNVLWNAFEEELVERAGKNTVSEADFSGMDEKVADIRQQIKDRKKEKVKEREKELPHVRVLEDPKKTYHTIKIFHSDLERIYETIPEDKETDGQIRKNKVADKQLRHLYAVLMVLYKYWGKVVIKKGGNNDLTRQKLAELSKMKSQHKNIYGKMKTLHELGAIRMDDSVEKNIKVKVVCGSSRESGLLFETNDYREACEKIINLVDDIKICPHAYRNPL